MRHLRQSRQSRELRSRRSFLLALLSGVTVPILCLAQQSPKVNRVGFLLAESVSGQAARLEALRAGLRELGYIEGKNILIELRSAEGNYDRLPEIAAELVRLQVDAVVAFGAKAVAASKRATTTIPIVIPSISDPVASGLVSSFSSPGGNIVGSDNMGRDVFLKRLELLREVLPRMSRVALVINPALSTSASVALIPYVAKSFQIQVHPFEARAVSEFRNTFASISKARVDALLVQQDTLFIANATEVARLAMSQRLPSAGTKEYAEAGGLFGYGTNDAELYRRAAYFVDRILKGAKPSELPIERASRFELIVNLRTARTLGITVPQSILLRADKLID